MGIGAIVMQGDKKLFEHSQHVKAAHGNSNNVAEYLALHSILDFLIKSNLQNEKILVRGDSKLAICQINMEWKIKQGHYVPLAHNARRKREQFTNISFQWIPREMNSIADKLSKGPMIEAGVQFRLQP